MGRNKEINEQMKDERKQQIFSSALKLFARKGLAATKISDIAKDAGFSQGLIYHYFDSKKEIFIQLIKMAFIKLNGAAQQLKSMDLPALQKIKLAYESLMQGLAASEEASLTHLLIATASASDSVPAEANRIIQEQYYFPYEVMGEIFKAGQNEGTIIKEKPKELALLFWSTIRGLSIYRAAHKKEFVAPDANVLLEMFRNKEEKNG